CPCRVRYGYAPKCIFVLLNSLMQFSDKICLLFMYTSSQSPLWSQLSMFMYVLSAGGYVGFIFRLVVSPLQELSQYEKAPKGVTVRNLFSRHPVMIR
uniref:Uncharacterized protein n=1 Tax=Aegilops tauschii subsp. strangulata TaxID=200361 RepID=A0A453L0J2_AEGTS